MCVGGGGGGGHDSFRVKYTEHDITVRSEIKLRILLLSGDSLVLILCLWQGIKYLSEVITLFVTILR